MPVGNPVVFGPGRRELGRDKVARALVSRQQSDAGQVHTVVSFSRALRTLERAPAADRLTRWSLRPRSPVDAAYVPAVSTASGGALLRNPSAACDDDDDDDGEKKTVTARRSTEKRDHGAASDIRHERGNVALLHRQPVHAGQREMFPGAQLRQKLHNGQQPSKGHGHRQRHTAQALTGDCYA